MNTAAAPLARDALLPRPPGGMARGLVLALFAHALLVVALSFSVNWHSSVPEASEAELWAATPQAAAPRGTAAEPPPSPPPARVRNEPVPTPAPEPPAARGRDDAQIAIERERERERRAADAEAAQKAKAKAEAAAQAQADDAAQRKADQAEKAQAEAAARAKADADARQKAAQRLAAQAERLEAQRQENLKRMVAAAGGTATSDSPATAARSAGPSADYIGRIRGRIRPNVVFPNTVAGNPAVEIDIRMAADGRILSSRITKSSGAPEWDDAVLRAIEKTEVLPRDENGRVPPALTIVYRPNN